MVAAISASNHTTYTKTQKAQDFSMDREEVGIECSLFDHLAREEFALVDLIIFLS